MGCGASSQRTFDKGETVMIIKKDNLEGKMGMVIGVKYYDTKHYEVFLEPGVQPVFNPRHLVPAQLTADDEHALKASHRSQQIFSVGAVVMLFSSFEVNGPEGETRIVEFRRSNGDYGVYFEDSGAAWYKPISLVDVGDLWGEPKSIYWNCIMKGAELQKKRLSPTFKMGDFVRYKNDDMYGPEGVPGIVDFVWKNWHELLVFFDDDGTGCTGSKVVRGAVLCSHEHLVPAQPAAEEEHRLKTLCETREAWRHSLKVDDAVIPFEPKKWVTPKFTGDDVHYYEGTYAFSALEDPGSHCPGDSLARLKCGDSSDHVVPAHMMRPADEAEAKKWGFTTCYSEAKKW